MANESTGPDCPDAFKTGIESLRKGGTLTLIGNLDVVSVCTPHPFHRNPVIEALKSGANVLVNQAPHYLDILQGFMGEIDELFGVWKNLNHPSVEVDDTALAILTIKNGRVIVEIFTAIYRSARDKKPVKFPVMPETGRNDFDGRLKKK